MTRIEELVEVEVLQDFPGLLFVLLRFRVLLDYGSLAFLLIWTDSFADETVFGPFKLCVPQQILQAISLALNGASIAFSLLKELVLPLLFEFEIWTSFLSIVVTQN